MNKKLFTLPRMKNFLMCTRKTFLTGLVIACAQVHSQQSYTFTTAGATGQYGPTQSMVNTAYSSTNLSGSVTIGTQQGIQEFTVPVTGGYRIEAWGGKGYGTNGGRGASIAGDFTLTAGQVLRILVGQQGVLSTNSNYSNQYGGGGGSFVTYTNNVPLVVAGGGGGSWAQSYTGLSDGTVSTTGLSGSNGPTNGAGGTSGSGGSSGGYADGGGGLTGNGGGTAGGSSFTNGGNGGSSTGVGAFGGGGGTSSWNNRRGGGGGGYSGGGGAGSTTTGYPEGGGGGSINNGANQTNASGANQGDGRVVITELCNISLSALGANSYSAICSGASATLITNAVSNYSWSTGATTSSIIVTPTATSVYSLSATSSSNCVASASYTLNVNEAVPQLTVANTASATGGICPNDALTLTAYGASSYTWTGSVMNGVAFYPTVSSGYTVTGGNACGTSTAATSVSVLPNPTVTAVASQPTICSGVSVSLTASGASTYSWSNGVPNGVGFTPATTATYVVTGTAAATGCTATAAVPVTVVTTPILAPVASPTLICNGFSSTLSASGASNYSWSPGQTTSSIVVNPTTTTTYTITKWNANCFDTKTITLFVNQPPTVFAIGNPTLVCAFQSATLNAGGGSTYTWAPYGGNSSQAIVSPGVTTNFTVTASDGTCSAAATLSLAVNPLPVLNITVSNSMICAGQQVNMTISGADTYSWTNPTGLGTATAIADSPLIPTSYNVTGTNTLTGCQSSTSQVVIVNPVPTLTVAATKTLVCVNGPSTLTVKGLVNNYTYSWNTGASTTATSNVVNSANTTVYSVTATNTITSCQSTSVVTVNVFQPTFAVNSPTSSCLGGTITLMASGANSYTWNGSQPFQSIQVSPTTPTFYVVAATTSTINNLSCVSSNTVTVNIYANPTITAVASRTIICRNESVDLTGGGATTYTWSSLQTGSVVTVSPSSQTNYVVTGTDQNGCKGTATVQVKVSSCSGIDSNGDVLKVSIYPNPSSGEVNVQSASNLELTLVDELGQVVRQLQLSEGNNRHATISGLAAGIYFITDSKSTMREKLVISK